MVMPDIAGSLGTWQWLAPEVIDRFGSTYDCRSDVYSFGIVCWELCSFEIPFLEYLKNEEYSCVAWDGNGKEIRQFNTEAMKEAIIEKNLRPTIPFHAPNEMRKLIVECFSSEPDERPYFTEIIPRICSFSGLPEPKSFQDFHYLVNDNSQTKKSSPLLPSKPKYQPPKLSSLPKNPGECKRLVSLFMTIPFQQKIRNIILHQESIWVAANNGILSRIGCDGKIKKTLIVHKDNNNVLMTSQFVPVFLDIHCILGYGDFVWGGCEDGSIIVWNTKTLKEVTRWNAHGVNLVKNLLLVETSKNTKTIWSVSPIDRSIYVWNVGDFKLIATVSSTLNRHAVNCITQHKEYIWIGGNGDLYLYHATTFQLRGSWRAHDSSVSCILSFGNRVWTGSATGDIKIWEDKVSMFFIYNNLLFLLR